MLLIKAESVGASSRPLPSLPSALVGIPGKPLTACAGFLPASEGMDGQRALTGHREREMNRIDAHLEHPKVHSLTAARCDQLLMEQVEYL